MKEEEKTEVYNNQIDEYADYIYDIVFKADFSNKSAYGDSISRLFSRNEETIPKDIRNTVIRNRYLLKYLLVYILTILYSNWIVSKKKTEENDETQNDEIRVSRTADSLTNEIMTIDKDILDVLSAYDNCFRLCYNVLRSRAREIIDMAKLLCKYEDTKLEIVNAGFDGDNITFTIVGTDNEGDLDSGSDINGADSFNETELYFEMPTYETSFGEKVLKCIFEYTKKRRVEIVIGLDKIDSAYGDPKKKIRIERDDNASACPISDYADGKYVITFTVITKKHASSLDMDKFNKFLGDTKTDVMIHSSDNGGEIEVVRKNGESIKFSGYGIESIIKNKWMQKSDPEEQRVETIKSIKRLIEGLKTSFVIHPSNKYEEIEVNFDDDISKKTRVVKITGSGVKSITRNTDVEEMDPLDNTEFVQFMEDRGIAVTRYSSDTCKDVEIIGDDGKSTEVVGSGIRYTCSFKDIGQFEEYYDKEEAGADETDSETGEDEYGYEWYRQNVTGSGDIEDPDNMYESTKKPLK